MSTKLTTESVSSHIPQPILTQVEGKPYYMLFIKEIIDQVPENFASVEIPLGCCQHGYMAQPVTPKFYTKIVQTSLLWLLPIPVLAPSTHHGHLKHNIDVCKNSCDMHIKNITMLFKQPSKIFSSINMINKT